MTNYGVDRTEVRRFFGEGPEPYLQRGRIVANTHKAGNDVVVVVSAQGDTTDDLIAKAAEITHNPSAREMDMLLAAGEEISIALLAMA